MTPDETTPRSQRDSEAQLLKDQNKIKTFNKRVNQAFATLGPEYRIVGKSKEGKRKALKLRRAFKKRAKEIGIEAAKREAKNK